MYRNHLLQLICHCRLTTSAEETGSVTGGDGGTQVHYNKPGKEFVMIFISIVSKVTE